MLCGTSALHATLTKWDDTRISCCPWERCSTEPEGCVHFLVRCKAFNSLRTSYTRALASDCTCEPEEGEEGFQICSTFYAGLDDEGKSVWVLGGPVDGRAPERSVDAAARIPAGLEAPQ